MTSKVCAWARKTFWVNIPCSLPHVRETIYNSTWLNKLVSKRLCINSVYDDLTVIRHEHVSWSPSRLTAEIQRFLLSVVVSSNCSPLFWQMIEYEEIFGCFSSHFFYNNQQPCKQPYLLPHSYISSSWFWVRLRDTNMADSNRCQAAGHMGANQEKRI